jgi:hypothetical protein
MLIPTTAFRLVGSGTTARSIFVRIVGILAIFECGAHVMTVGPPENTPMRETWGAMEELVDEGLTKNIGLRFVTYRSQRLLITLPADLPIKVIARAH